jgi:hypothetical protein
MPVLRISDDLARGAFGNAASQWADFDEGRFGVNCGRELALLSWSA